ncbi:MAG: hypothetical protein HQ591_09985 [candidate division Zixibacteria bacterium]|nr:hypothetical protein [Candidatus Tariuqbacter arcticus]
MKEKTFVVTTREPMNNVEWQAALSTAPNKTQAINSGFRAFFGRKRQSIVF